MTSMIYDIYDVVIGRIIQSYRQYLPHVYWAVLMPPDSDWFNRYIGNLQEFKTDVIMGKVLLNASLYYIIMSIQPKVQYV